MCNCNRIKHYADHTDILIQLKHVGFPLLPHFCPHSPTVWAGLQEPITGFSHLQGPEGCVSVGISFPPASSPDCVCFHIHFTIVHN